MSLRVASIEPVNRNTLQAGFGRRAGSSGDDCPKSSTLFLYVSIPAGQKFANSVLHRCYLPKVEDLGHCPRDQARLGEVRRGARGSDTEVGELEDLEAVIEKQVRAD